MIQIRGFMQKNKQNLKKQCCQSPGIFPEVKNSIRCAHAT